MVKEVQNNDLAEALAADLAIIDFNAVWCGPCKMLGPVLEEVSEEKVDTGFYGVDVDENPDLAQQFKVTNIPTLVAVKNGEVVGKQVGFLPKPALVEWIESCK